MPAALLICRHTADDGTPPSAVSHTVAVGKPLQLHEKKVKSAANNISRIRGTRLGKEREPPNGGEGGTATPRQVLDEMGRRGHQLHPGRYDLNH